MGQFDFFKVMITVQLFWAIGITMLTAVMPVGDIQTLSYVQYENGTFDLLTVKAQFEESIANQVNIPFVDVGTLVFYSGNLILDLMLNFFLFVPQMFNILITLLGRIFLIDGTLIALLQLFLTVFIGVMYVIGLLQFVSTYRNPGGV